MNFNRFSFYYSLGDLNNIRNVTELLSDMVYALNPSDQEVDFVGL